MTSKININLKNLSKNKKVVLFMLIGLFVVGLTSGIIKVFAYYQEKTTSVIFANKVGDFDIGNAEVNMMIYKENADGKYIRSYGVPEDYYEFDDTLTKCTIPCNDNSGNCNYTYDGDNFVFHLSSNQKVTCKFYFNKTSETDIQINVMVQDENGDYKLKNEIPAYGYIYSNNASCDNGSIVIYNSETRTFTINSVTKDTCYVYFDRTGFGDITVNTYVEEESGTRIYTKVDSIPMNNIYILNNNKSVCNPVMQGGEAGVITYENGYININSKEQQICDVYLDLNN